MSTTISISQSDPHLAQEAFGWDPTEVTHGSGIQRAWRCKSGHVFVASPNSRTSRGKIIECPQCSGLTPTVGVNDLGSTHPEIAAEAYLWDPSTVTAGVGLKKNWMCANGHIYLARIAHRTRGSGCPYCANRKVLSGFNDLKTTHPQLAGQALGWDPTTISYGSGKKLFWKCSAGHVFIASPNQRTNKHHRFVCPYSSFGIKHL
jgi:hypothetical protein